MHSARQHPWAPWTQHLRVGEGEFDGEFDGNSMEFDAGFGEFDVFSMLAEL